MGADWIVLYNPPESGVIMVSEFGDVLRPGEWMGFARRDVVWMEGDADGAQLYVAGNSPFAFGTGRRNEAQGQ